MSDGNLNQVTVAPNEPATVRIRAVSESVRDLLLRDRYGNDALLSTQVREGLEEIQLQLTDLEGMQLLFELWVGEEKT